MSSAIFSQVANRGIPPQSFVAELVAWAKKAPDEIFAPNDNPADIYALIAPKLGPWEGPLHRRASLLHAATVHAGFESGWNWNEGVDRTNKTSMANVTGQETGIFQVSFDSVYIHGNSMMGFANEHAIATPLAFIAAMKERHELAIEYYARLVRVNIRWAGPLVRGEILPWLSREAVKEFGAMLSA